MAVKKLNFCEFLLVVILLVLSENSANVVTSTEEVSERRPLVPAMFIFGDSLIDNGNNNKLITLAKANYLPYGVDFDGGPTGRFTNGYTIVDTIAELLGLPLIPANSEASADDLQYGVNFASAAAGILDITGQHLGGRIPFNEQIGIFEDSLDQIKDSLGAPDVLSKCIFFVGMGNNDYLNNYLSSSYDTKSRYDGQQYADLLSHDYSQQLNKLYDLGARKFVITGLGPMGYIPNFSARSKDDIKDINLLIELFNTNIKSMITNLRVDLRGSAFTYIDVNHMLQDLLANPTTYGFSNVNRGCCGIRRNNGKDNCMPYQTPCQERNQSIFFDAYHPTEAVNVLFGQKAFSGSKDVVYPINIQQLANL